MQYKCGYTFLSTTLLVSWLKELCTIPIYIQQFIAFYCYRCRCKAYTTNSNFPPHPFTAIETCKFVTNLFVTYIKINPIKTIFHAKGLCN